METITVNGRYHLLHLISDGPGGRVYLAEDRRRRNGPVVLKADPETNRDSAARRREILARCALRHPNLNAIVDVGRVSRLDRECVVPAPGALMQGETPRGVRDDEAPATSACFLVSRFLAGPHIDAALAQALREAGNVEALDDLLTRVVLHVLRALRYLHERSLIHFDVKPAHIILEGILEGVLEGPTPGGSPCAVADGRTSAPNARTGAAARDPGPRVTLIDLGLAERSSTPLGSRVRGTPPFIAPEILGQSMVDHRVDLFSLGATLYHALTEGILLQRNSLEEVQAMSLRNDWPPLTDLAPEVPVHWAHWIHRLLEPNPSHRPESAAALIEEIRPAGSEPERGWTAFEPGVPPHSDRKLGEERSAHLVLGHEREFDSVAREIERLTLGESCGALVMLSGELGTGRRALVRRLADLARLNGLEVLRTRCTPRGGAPLAPLAELLSAMRDSLATPATCHRELEALIRWCQQGDTGDEELFPQLFDAEREDLRLMGKLCSLFEEFGHTAPTACIVEELQHASPEFLRVLGHLSTVLRGDEDLETPGPPPSRILFLASLEEPARSGEPAGESVSEPIEVASLSRLPSAMQVAIRPITIASTRKLMRELLGPCHSPAPILSELHRRSRGMSRALGQIVEESRRLGFFRREGASWKWVGPEPAMPAILEAREREWSALDEGEQQTIELLATAGGSMASRELRSCLQLLSAGREDGSDSRAILESLRRRGWISSEFDVESYFLERQPPPLATEASARQRANSTRAHALLIQRPENPMPAVQLLLDAADRAELPALLPRALEVLRESSCHASLLALCSRLKREAPALLEPEFLLLEAESAHTLGDDERALAAVQAALTRSPPPPLELRCALLEIALLRTRREFGRARTTLDSALATVRGSRRDLEPDSSIQLLLEGAELDLAEGAYDSALEWCDRAAEATPANLDELVKGPELQLRQVLLRCRVLLDKQLPDRARRTLQEYLHGQSNLFPRRLRGHLLDRLAALEFERGELEISLRHSRESATLHRSLGDLYALAGALNNEGRLHTQQGDPEQAELHHREALGLWHRVGYRHGIAIANNNLGLVHKLQMRLDPAEASFRRALDLWRELDMQSFQSIALNNLSDILMSKGEYSRALQCSQQSFEIRKAIGNPGAIAFAYYRMAKIYRTQGELDLAWDFAEKSLNLRRTAGERTHLPYSLKLSGELLILRGNYADGIRLLRQALSNFEALGNKMGRSSLLALFAETSRQLGLFADARDYAQRALELASEEKVAYYIGASRLMRGQVALSEGELTDAKSDIEAAERAFREGHNRRDVAIVLLTRARLELAKSQLDRAEVSLAEAYTHIEELGLLDLAPTYYRLRARVLLEATPPDLAVAHKLLERALEECVRLDVPEEMWRIHAQLSGIYSEENNLEAALHHGTQASEILHRMHESLPAQFRDSYLETPARAEVLGRWQDRGGEAGGTPPDSRDAGSRELPLVTPDPEAEPELHAAELTRLQEINLLLSTERDLEQLLARLLDSVLELFRAERGFLILVGESGELEIRVARNIDREEVEQPEYKFSRSIAREVARTGQIFLTHDARRDGRLTDSTSVHDLRLQSIACFPLESRGRRIGVIYLENRFSKDLVPAAKVPLLKAFSSQAAIAVENAQLLAENERRRQELEESRDRIENLNHALSERVAEQSRQLEHAMQEIQRQQDQLESRFQFHNILGACPQMQELYRLLERVAATDLPVLIEGESGTGKELVARAIHYCQQSRRRKRPFISENCGAVAESLFESEVFGHVRGSFTGAERDREGLFAVAEGGTLFLDEIHALSRSTQGKLLRVLQEGEYRPVGGSEFVQTDVRLLSACNQPLRQLVQGGRFREDLYYRLDVLRIELPPLRERGRDVLLLARHFLEQVVQHEGLPAKEFSADSLRLLLHHPFPGNVRELRNAVEKAAVLSPQSVIKPHDLFLAPAEEATYESLLPSELAERPLREAKDAFQREYLEALIRRHDGVIARAARTAGVTRESLHRLLRRHGVKRSSRR